MQVATDCVTVPDGRHRLRALGELAVAEAMGAERRRKHAQVAASARWAGSGAGLPTPDGPGITPVPGGSTQPKLRQLAARPDSSRERAAPSVPGVRCRAMGGMLADITARKPAAGANPLSGTLQVWPPVVVAYAVSGRGVCYGRRNSATKRDPERVACWQGRDAWRRHTGNRWSDDRGASNHAAPRRAERCERVGPFSRHPDNAIPFADACSRPSISARASRGQ